MGEPWLCGNISALFKAAVVAAAFSMITGPAWGQLLCAPRDDVIEQLQREYDEVPVQSGITKQNGQLIELFMSKGGATWTLLVTLHDGRSCPVAFGIDWGSAPSDMLKPTGLPI